MTVLKFGGTSLGTPERVKAVVEIIADAHLNHGARAVVCSAFGGATDTLIQLARIAASPEGHYQPLLDEFTKRHFQAIEMLIPESDRTSLQEDISQMLKDLGNMLHGVALVGELTRRTLDFIMSFGERLSAKIVCAAVAQKVPDVTYLDARELISTNAKFGAAQVNREATENQIRAYFAANDSLQIVTGFIAYAPSKETTTLGRGGSDFTASLLGASLNSQEIQIWTDVDGVLTADPRKVTGATTIEAMSYEEAMEMAHFGAKVIYPPTMAPALSAGVPIRIKNTFNPTHTGTLVAGGPPAAVGPITGISSMDHVSLVQIRGCGLIGVAGTCNRLFGALAQAGVNIILISQGSSEHSICCVVAPSEAGRAKKAIDEAFALEIMKGQIEPVHIEHDLAVVAVVGEGMRQLPGVAGQVFQALGARGVNVVAIAQGSSELNISFVVHRQAIKAAMQALHDGFFASSKNKQYVFLIGLGLIGNELIQQFSASGQGQTAPILAGIANSKRMLFNPQGISLDSWQEALESEGAPASMDAFFEQIVSLPVGNKVLVDCTANYQVTELYERALRKNIRVVTPNKKACADRQARYDRLMALAETIPGSFRYEAVVCAGLPVLGQLKQMMATGDRLLKLQAVLSGSLSFILNSVSKDVSFSKAVRKAKDLGYTEPDPADDLGGMDMARKLLILARHAGFRLEMEDIDVQSLLPTSAQGIKDPVAFWRALETEDSAFEARRAEAWAQGNLLRYIASFENGTARIALEAVGKDHPCYGLNGADNIVILTTERYATQPLVIKGPGAGAAVTAAQVYADILAI